MSKDADQAESSPERGCHCSALASAASQWSTPRLVDVGEADEVNEADDSEVRMSPLREIGLGRSAFREIGLGAGPAVPASSANLDYRAALHTNAGVRQLSLDEFLE